MTYERKYKQVQSYWYLTCQGLSVVLLGGAVALLLETGLNIVDASKDLPPLLTFRAPAFEVALDWFYSSLSNN